MPKIQIATGPQAGQTLTINGERFVIGRAPECELMIDIPAASRHHACLYLTDGQWRLQDLGSANGTSLNGKDIRDAAITAGDKFAIGNYTFIFEDAGKTSTPPPLPSMPTPTPVSDGEIRNVVRKMSEKTRLIEAEIGKAIIGQKDIVMQVLAGVLSNGHVLMIGMPGLAKTMMIRTLSEVLDLKFRRIQFTPDLMPSDITGTDVLEIDEASGRKEYRFIQGPIFTNILLADEINRTPPKTQAALLEAMQEHRVTAGGKTYQLSLPFFVLATQNPLEQEGTYPLPEAQLDRFMFSVYIDYPKEAEEESIAKLTTASRKLELQKVLTAPEILELQDVVRNLPISDHVVKFATRLARATRPGDVRAPEFIKKWIHCGAGPRASQYLVLGAKARAVIDGRLLVNADDVRAVARPVLRHRMFTNFTADSEGMDTDKIVQMLLDAIPEPGEGDY